MWNCERITISHRKQLSPWLRQAVSLNMILLTNYSHLNFQSLKMAEITHIFTGAFFYCNFENVWWKFWKLSNLNWAHWELLFDTNFDSIFFWKKKKFSPKKNFFSWKLPEIAKLQIFHIQRTHSFKITPISTIFRWFLDFRVPPRRGTVVFAARP